MKKALVLVLMMFVCAGGCRVLSERDTQEVKDTILRYNKLLSEGYAHMDMSPLREVATEEQAQKVYQHMAALGEAGVRMESQVVNIVFLEIKFPKKNLSKVITKEKWNYSHIKIGTAMPGQTVVRGVVYKLSYELVRKNEKWLVSSVSVLAGDSTE
jgi:hypothetical protein